MATTEPDCTNTGCNFGTPLPIPKPRPCRQLGHLRVQHLQGARRGDAQSRTTGDAELNVSLNSTIFLTGEALCPKCIGERHCARKCGNREVRQRPEQGTGLRAAPTRTGLTRDCPPKAVLALRHRSASCCRRCGRWKGPSQRTDGGVLLEAGRQRRESRNMKLGCFGSDQCRSITEPGCRPGCSRPGTPSHRDAGLGLLHPGNGNGAVDGIVPTCPAPERYRCLGRSCSAPR